MWTFVFSLWDNVFMAYDSEKEAKRLSFCLLSSAHFRWWNIASDWADRRVSIRLLAFNALSMFLAGTSVFGFTWAASAAAADATLRNGWKRMGIPVATLSWQPFSLSVSLYRIFQMEILVIYVLYPLLSLSVMDHSFALFFFSSEFYHSVVPSGHLFSLTHMYSSKIVSFSVCVNEHRWKLNTSSFFNIEFSMGLLLDCVDGTKRAACVYKLLSCLTGNTSLRRIFIRLASLRV